MLPSTSAERLRAALWAPEQRNRTWAGREPFHQESVRRVKAFLNSKNPEGDVGLSGTSREGREPIALRRRCRSAISGLGLQKSEFQPCLCPLSPRDLEQVTQLL